MADGRRVVVRRVRLMIPGMPDEVTDVTVGGGAVTFGDAGRADGRQVNGEGWIAAPGLIDLHVHLREPGQTHKEDICSGTRAAAKGGFAAVVCEPNTTPPLADAATIGAFRNALRASACVEVYAKSAITEQRAGRVPAMATHNEVVVGHSDDGDPVAQRAVMAAAFQRAHETMAVWQADQNVWEMDEGLRKSALPRVAPKMADYLPLFLLHEEATPGSLGALAAELGEADPYAYEARLIARDLELLEATPKPRPFVHFSHVTLAESVEHLRAAKARGLPVTAEATPHHLTLSADDIPGRDPNWKMNPPLRSRADVAALQAALRDGVIDCIASDHAPHTPAEKAAGWEAAPFGCIGMETTVGVVLTRLVDEGVITLERAIEALSYAPLRVLLRDGCAGQVLTAEEIAQRYPVRHLTLINPAAEWTVEPAQFESKCRNTPFAGWQLRGRVEMTVVNGEVVFPFAGGSA